MTTTATAAAPAGAAASGQAGGSTTGLAGLANNFNDFLNLLLTQLKNQDPTTPMDANQFTSELVQFTSVEQQITTNSSLGSLISLTQSGQLLQSSALVGHAVTVSGDQLPLQGGHAAATLSPAQAGPVTVTVSTPAGLPVYAQTVNAGVGSTAWSWNGVAADGSQLPDGAYKIAATDANGGAVPFTVTGTATGLQRSGSALKLSLGQVQVDMSAVQALGS